MEQNIYLMYCTLTKLLKSLAAEELIELTASAICVCCFVFMCLCVCIVGTKLKAQQLDKCVLFPHSTPLYLC